MAIKFDWNCFEQIEKSFHLPTSIFSHPFEMRRKIERNKIYDFFVFQRRPQHFGDDDR